MNPESTLIRYSVIALRLTISGDDVYVTHIGNGCLSVLILQFQFFSSSLFCIAVYKGNQRINYKLVSQ